MTIIQSIILGIVQGITEFLPISSSGHLVLTPFLFGWQIPADQAFVFDVLVQVATLVAVVTYFWQDLIAIFWATLRGIFEKHPFSTPEARLGWYLVLATIPAATIGVIIQAAIENAFESPYAVSIFLLVTAVLLLLAERVGRHNRPMESLNWRDALIMGSFQILALFPGISRSGATITGGMIQNLERTTAARFSFMMSIPVMLAAGLLATVDMLKIPNVASFLPSFIPGFITSAVVGYLAIRWLLSFLNHHPLHVFAIYCAILGLISLALVIF